MRQKKSVSPLSPKLFDVVELVAARPDMPVAKGTVGTIVEELDRETYLVEFSDSDGRTIAVEPVAGRDLMRHE